MAGENGVAAAPKKVAAARAERTGKPKKIKWRELSLTLPAELPTTFFFDMALLEKQPNNPMPIMRLLLTLLGDEQFNAVRNEMPEGDDAFQALLNTVFKPYGISLGESSASPAS